MRGWVCADLAAVIMVVLSGSTATVMMALPLVCLICRETPVKLPPVPTPQTRMSILPSVSSQISRPVVLSWIAGLAGFSNWCGPQYLAGSRR